ncbi:SDR family NAD(P)-dependent oxidoreductase [Halostella salina]|uniref:SDR family NAD(P)-dependent oxidoreductase n=1 Tax=Halostella salina TaxID=1547897 RepID=UPI000EF7A445|nr:SDR family NAD(P)-dependent oxidoreductase [Halostella salina]
MSDAGHGTNRTVLIAGVGETLGTALARAFADAGDAVALLARSPDHVESLAADLRRDGADAVAVTADVTDPDAVADAFDAVRAAFGQVDVLVHNASAPAGGPVDDCDPAAFERPWRVRTYGGYLCAREALADGGDPTVLFSGTSYAVEPTGRMPDWSSAAFATRGLAASLDDGPADATYVAIGATVAPPGGYVTDDRVAAEAVAARFVEFADDPPEATTVRVP